MNERLSTSQHSAWLLSAMIAPTIQAASNCSWLVTLTISGLCLAVWLGLTRFEIGANTGRLLGAIQWLWILLIISEFLHWTMLYWPTNGSYHAVPLALLALGAWAAARGVSVCARAGGIVRWFAVLLLGGVVLSAVKEVRLENLRPSWEIQTAHLINVMLIPIMGLGMGSTSRKWRAGLLAVVIAAVTSGVLSMKLIYHMEAPFYEMSRGLTLLGIGQRFESLVAAGMTLGFFALTTYLVSIAANAWDQGANRGRSVWITAGITAVIFLSGMRMNSRLLAMGILIAWVILPVLKKMIKIVK